MCKRVLLCAGLFGAATLVLALGASWLTPAALPVFGALLVCLVGVVLILAAPGAELSEDSGAAAELDRLDGLGSGELRGPIPRTSPPAPR